LPVFACCLTVFFATIITLGALNPPGNGGSALPFTDKQLHFIAFFVLTLPLAMARPRWMLWFAPLALAYGAAIELIQPSVGRSGDVADFAADALGVLCGLSPALLSRYKAARNAR